MIIFLIGGLLLGATAVVFVLQSVSVVTITFFSWSLTGSLSVVLLLAILVGILITLLFLLPGSISNLFKYRKFKKEIERLEEELKKQKELTHFAKTTPPTPLDIAKIERGAISEPEG